jgi:glyceraldehyde-3-phosphate dehydrogenase (NAD(P))
MELVGVADVAPTLPLRALQEIGAPFKVFFVDEEKKDKFAAAGVQLAGSLDDLLSQVDVALDATPGGVGARMKEPLTASTMSKPSFRGEKDDIADVFFHGYANYENGIGKDFLKLTSYSPALFGPWMPSTER